MFKIKGRGARLLGVEANFAINTVVTHGGSMLSWWVPIMDDREIPGCT